MRGIRWNMDHVPCSVVHLQPSQVLLNLRRDRRCRAAAKMSFHFEAVKSGWIVACGNHDSAREFPPADFKGNVRCGIRTVQHHNAEAVGRDHLCSRACECFRLKSHVESNENGAFTALDGFKVICRGLRGGADVVECERVGDDAAPTVGTETDWTFHSEEKSVTTLLSPRTTRARSFADRPI